MRSHRYTCLVSAAAGAIALSVAAPALAGPLDELFSQAEAVEVGEVGGYVLRLVTGGPGSGDPGPVVGDLPALPDVGAQIRLVALINEAYEPLDGPVRENYSAAGGMLLGLLDSADTTANRTATTVNRRIHDLADLVNAQCGECLPGLGGGPIGPVPVGPVGDTGLATVNDTLGSAQATFFVVGGRISAACGNCLPGLGGGPIGPVPVGPVGDSPPPA